VCRQPEEDIDKFIFELFNLGQRREGNIIPQAKKELTKEELTTMIYNLPHSAIIKSKKRQAEGGSTEKKGLPFAGLGAKPASDTQDQEFYSNNTTFILG